MVLLADRSRLRWSHVFLSAMPYLVALAAWGIYIAQAPHLFMTQFTGNASGRGPGITHPWDALKLELTHRYGEAFGMAGWTSGPARAKIVVLLLYVAGLVWVTASPRVCAIRNVKLAWAAAWSVLVFCWLLEGSKNFMYLPHILPWLCLLAAVALCDLAHASRWTAAVLLLAVVSIQVLSTAMPARRNPYGKLFLPAMSFLKEHAQPDDTVMADAVVGFELGFDRRVVDDAWLGYRTGKSADWLVITPVYASLIDSLATLHPDIARHVNDLLQQYTLAYQNDDYRIYSRKRS
jgi:hypothetical protein